MPINYCSHCGNPVLLQTPEGDDRPRHVCPECGRIHYINPRLVVGCVVEWGSQILLCQRSIEPRYGMWTVPAGFLEAGESAAEGAKRETLEEANARVEIIAPYTLFNLTFINQIYLLFRSRLIDGKFGSGAESLNVELFDEADIPWDDIAFTAVYQTLKHYVRDRAAGEFPFHMGDIEPDRPR